MAKFGGDAFSADQGRTFVADTLTLMQEAISLLRDRGFIGLVSSLFLARAMQALDACLLLGAAGLRGDAMSSARTVVELDIEHAYIMRDVEDRWEKYMLFDDVSANKIVQAISMLHGAEWPEPEALQEWNGRSIAAKQAVGSSRNWAGKTSTNQEIDLRSRAIAVDRQHQYDLAYREMCGASHGGFATLEYVMPKGPYLPVKILIGRDQPSTRAVELALPSALGICKAAGHAQSDEALCERAEAIGLRIAAIHPPKT